jgi:hypothetical protein
MLLRNHHFITKLATACLSIFFLIVTFVPSASAHSDTHAPSVTAAQKHIDPVPKATFFQPCTQSHTFSVDYAPAKDNGDCQTKCCKLLAGAKISCNTRLSNEKNIYINHTEFESQYYLNIAGSVKFDDLLPHSHFPQDKFKYRILLI